MPEEKRVDKRPWYWKARLQGVLLLGTGIAMCFFPPTHPYADTVITAGVAGIVTGTSSAVARKIFNAAKPK